MIAVNGFDPVDGHSVEEIDFSEVQNKLLQSNVYDFVDFDYKSEDEDIVPGDDVKFSPPRCLRSPTLSMLLLRLPMRAFRLVSQTTGAKSLLALRLFLPSLPPLLLTTWRTSKSALPTG